MAENGRDQNDAVVSPPKCTDPDALYRQRVFVAECWANMLLAYEIERARTRYHVSPRRAARYAFLEDVVLGYLAAPARARISNALGVVLENIEAIAYDVPRPALPADPLLADLVRQGCAHVGI